MSTTDPGVSPDGPLPDDADVGGGPLSFIDRLRASRDELTQEHTLDIPIPGYPNDGLVVRYKALPFTEAEQVATRLQRERGPQALRSSQETLIRSCVEIFTRQGGELVALHEAALAAGVPVEPGVPIRFDEQLGLILGFEATSARDAVYGAFGSNEHAKYAIVNTNIRLSQWMIDVTAEVDEGLDVGEA